MKKRIFGMACTSIALILMLASCSNAETGTADIFGQYGDFNYPLTVSAKQDNRFRLSEKRIDVKYDSSDSDDNIEKTVDYKIEYGSYPCILADNESDVLNKAFSMKLLNYSNEEADVFTQEDGAFEYHNLFGLAVERRATIERTDSGSVYMYSSKPADCMISAVSENEISEAAKEDNMQYVSTPIAKNAVVFFTSVENETNNLSKEDVVNIYKYGSGYSVYQREKDSETRIVFDKLIMQGGKSVEGEKVRLRTTDSVVAGEYVNSKKSIGYCLYSQYLTKYAKDSKIKLLSIGNALATQDSISDGSYPYSLTYKYYYKTKDTNGTAGVFLKWLLSKDGQDCIKSTNFIPI